MPATLDLERYARHLLLPEIGERGQAALCESESAFDSRFDAGVRAVASAYLSRAGVLLSSGAGSVGSGVDAERVAAVAGDEALEPAARALLGALVAVEEIKRTTGAGTLTPSIAGTDLRLSGDDT